MNTQLLLDFLSRIRPFSDEFIKAFVKEITPISLPRNYLLLEAPRISDYVYFLESGYAMSYTFHKGRKQVENFWSSGQVILSPKSFFEQVPSREFIQLLQNSELMCVTYSNVQKLLSLYPESNIVQQYVMVQALETERERIRDMHSMDTTMRHAKLLKHYPGLEQATSQENIASFLGVTPQTLSRIKRESNEMNME